MALIKPVKGILPEFGKNCFLAENSTIVGDVIMGDDCSVWFNTVIRGDVNTLEQRVGMGSKPPESPPRNRGRFPSAYHSVLGFRRGLLSPYNELRLRRLRLRAHAVWRVTARADRRCVVAEAGSQRRPSRPSGALDRVRPAVQGRTSGVQAARAAAGRGRRRSAPAVARVHPNTTAQDIRETD